MILLNLTTLTTWLILMCMQSKISPAEKTYGFTHAYKEKYELINSIKLSLVSLLILIKNISKFLDYKTKLVATR